MDEWPSNPQAAAIASLPLMEIVRIGAQPAGKASDGDGRCWASACST